jgi:hypothetical protein
MSALTETSLTSTKATFPAAPDPIQGILTLVSLINLMLHICRCLQTQKTPASATMNMMFCATSLGLYSIFTNEAYPTDYFPFTYEVDSIPDFSACNSDNERETLKATNVRNQKTRADIFTINTALSDVFLANLPKAIRETYEPIRRNNRTQSSYTFLTGSSRRTAKQRLKIAKRIGNEWLPTGNPPTASSPLQRASSLTHPTQARHATQWTIATSSTLACASSNDVECTPIQILDRPRERVPANQRNNRILQRILVQRDCTRQPDSCPSLATWIRHGRHGQ